MQIYANLCKLDGFVEFKNQLWQNPRNISLDGNIKLHYRKVCRNVQTCVEMTPTFLDKNTFCVEIACVEVTDTLDT